MSGPNSQLAVKQTCHFDMDDMALWHQFITETAITISPAWERELPRLALTCDYLMHGILAMGALHLAFLYPQQRDKYEDLANQHQDLALRPFQSATSHITAENCNHVFGFSVLLMVFNYASFRSPEELLPFSGGVPYGGLSNWIVCLRGCSSIYQQAKSHIENGPLGFLVSQQSMSAIENAGKIECPPDDDDKSLEYLTKHLLNSDRIKASTTIEELEAYTDAIIRLRKLLVGSSQVTDLGFRKMMSSMWPTVISETYLRLLSQQQPLALIIMAHYCLLVKKCEAYWYMSMRAFDMFEAIRRSRGPDVRSQPCPNHLFRQLTNDAYSQWFLSEEWFPYIEHPLRVFDSRI